MRLNDTRFMLCSLLSLFAASSVHAANVDLESCAVIKNDAERLVCYDKVSGRSKGTKKSLKEGRWRASVTREPLDDSKTTHLFLVAESGRNYKSDRPRLNIRCMSKEQELYITWDTFVASNYSTIKMRVDDNEAFQEDMMMSTDNQATFTYYPEKYWTQPLSDRT